jgi:hypothetical protein
MYIIPYQYHLIIYSLLVIVKYFYEKHQNKTPIMQDIMNFSFMQASEVEEEKEDFTIT